MVRNFAITSAVFGAAFCAAFGLMSVTPALAQDAADGAKPAMGHHWQAPSPQDMAAWHKQMCDDHYAHAAGRLAFVEAKLDVTDAQRPLFDRWRDVVLHDAQARKEFCLAHQHVAGEQHSIVERTAMMQKRLETRLAAMRSEEPALDAFYQSLAPEQKAELDHAHHGFGRGHEGGMHHHDHEDGHG